MNKSDVVIVVPIYQEQLKKTEEISLRQLYKILGDYPICFIAPNRMRDYFKKKNSLVEFFPDDCFCGVGAYSDLLLSEEFYQRFVKYQYMLIYQLDAFVFSDRLLEFCEMGYDYIGAPMSRWSSWRGLRTKVGNGGLSLRKVDKCLYLIRKYKQNALEILSADFQNEEKYIPEDMFFVFCGYQYKKEFCVPSIKEAFDFAIENNVAHCYRRVTEKKLPFGCHGWCKAQCFDFWRKYIEMQVGDIQSCEEEVQKDDKISWADVRRNGVNEYILKRIIRKPAMVLKQYMDKILPKSKQYIIWGNGVVGKMMLDLLQRSFYSIYCIYDKNANKQYCDVNGIQAKYTQIEELLERKYIVIVSSTKFEKEIVSELDSYGLKKSIDYFTYREIVNRISNEYLRHFKWHDSFKPSPK